MNAPDQPAPSAGQARPQVALAGNPNSGKTTLFNALTGARARQSVEEGRLARVGVPGQGHLRPRLAGARGGLVRSVHPRLLPADGPPRPR